MLEDTFKNNNIASIDQKKANKLKFLGKYLTPETRMKRLIIMSVILIVYFLLQAVLYCIIRETWIFVFNIFPIIISALLLGTWTPIFTGVIIHLSNAVIIRLHGSQSLENLGLGILFNIFFIIMSAGIGRISELAKKAHLSEAVMFKLKEEAEKATRIKSEFIANISHEIRTPMNSIIGYAQVLKEKITEPDQCSDIEIIIKASNTLLNLINDLLDFSKIEAGKMELQIREFRISEIFYLLSDFFSYQALKKKIKYSLNIDVSVPEVLYGDDKKIQQILMNIIGNAFKFTESGEIEVRCSYNDPFVVISVKDTGIGISEDMQNKIFTPFIQGKESISGTHGGTGLGLTITKKLIELMLGNLQFTSKPGKGSIFTISLPLQKQEMNKNRNSGISHKIEEIIMVNNPDKTIKTKIPLENQGPIKNVIKILETSYDIFNPIKLESELEYIESFLPLSLKAAVIKKLKNAIKRYDDDLIFEVISDIKEYLGE